MCWDNHKLVKPESESVGNDELDSSNDDAICGELRGKEVIVR